MSDGGNGATKQVRGAQLVLTLDFDTRELTISGAVGNLNDAMDILARATREMEFRWRAQRALADLQPGAEDLALFSRGGGHRV